jgi:hypothetical protein
VEGDRLILLGVFNMELLKCQQQEVIAVALIHSHFKQTGLVRSRLRNLIEEDETKLHGLTRIALQVHSHQGNTFIRSQLANM